MTQRSGAPTLPVAPPGEVRRYARGLVLRHRGELTWSLLLYALATTAGLVAPQLLGRLVENAGRDVDDTTLAICAAVIVQAVLTRFALLASLRLGGKVLAGLREEFIGRVLSLPTARVERASPGELVTRTTRDVDVLAGMVQRAVPDTLIALVTIALTLGAVVFTAPLLVLPCLIAIPVLWLSTRWYLRRARAGYLRANASYVRLTEGLAETVGGARTVDALRLAGRRLERADRDIAESLAAERRTLYLRSVYLPLADTGYILPVAATLVIGGLMYIHGQVALASVITATLYMQQIIGPVDTLLYWMDELQVGGASMARIIGVSWPGDHDGAPDSLPRNGSAPAGHDIVARGVRYAYREGQDILQGVDLRVEPGERLAIVGPSGAGKSTLGRLLAGIYTPSAGTIAIGDVPLADLPPAELRRRIALVTQEYHIFRGTVRDNLLIAKSDAGSAEMENALKAVGAWEWASALGLDCEVGSGATALSPAQAQQLALARTILSDPRALVLDEATALLDPRAARDLEQSLAAVMAGRTVISIAHRLHTARDADRVVVLEEGRVTEVGAHAELVALGGSYARLWKSWHGSPCPVGQGASAPDSRRPPAAG